MVKRVLSIVLLAASLLESRIESCTGLTDQSIKFYGREMRNAETAGLLKLKKRSGRPCKAVRADMIQEKVGISMSLRAVGRFLKTASRY